jgi:hypothetical protein
MFLFVVFVFPYLFLFFEFFNGELFGGRPESIGHRKVGRNRTNILRVILSLLLAAFRFVAMVLRVDVNLTIVDDFA